MAEFLLTNWLVLVINTWYYHDFYVNTFLSINVFVTERSILRD